MNSGRINGIYTILRKRLLNAAVNHYGKLGKVRRTVAALRWESENYSEFRRPRNDLLRMNTESAWMSYISPDSVVWDVGACIGTFALFIARHVVGYGIGHVIAFEPESQNFGALCRNIRLNGLSNVTAYPIAVGRHLRVERFSVRRCAPGYSGHWIGDSTKPSDLVQGTLEASIDELVCMGIPSPQHIKIDVDGHERHVLGGMHSLLEGNSVRSLHIEWDCNRFGDCPLGNYGYILSGRSEPAPGIFNLIYTRMENDPVDPVNPVGGLS